MNAVDLLDQSGIRAMIRDVPDYPRKGVTFRDITPLLGNAEKFSAAVEGMAAMVPKGSDVVVGIESRGFILGAAVACRLGMPFAPIRKMGKLPRNSLLEEYDLEYGKAAIEMHADALEAHRNAVIVDDVLATGGTATAAARLVERLGGTVTGLVFLIELSQFGGRPRLGKYSIGSLVVY